MDRRLCALYIHKSVRRYYYLVMQFQAIPLSFNNWFIISITKDRDDGEVMPRDRLPPSSEYCSLRIFLLPLDLAFFIAFSDAGEHIGKPSLRIDVIELGGHDQRCHECGPISTAVGAGEQPRFSAKSHPPFILPMSATKSRFIIAGIRISAKRCLFGASKNERQVGF